MTPEQKERRERIAIAAMQGMCAHPEDRPADLIAWLAVEQADRLIELLDEAKPK
jgi:hypothetical protein